MTIDFPELKRVLLSFHYATGHRVTFSDIQGRVVMTSSPLCPFCRAIHKLSGAVRYCNESDLKAFAIAREKEADVMVYRCHAGLCEVIAPIRFGEVYVGILMLGPFLDSSSIDDQWQEVRSRCEGRFDISLIKDEFFELMQYDEDMIAAYTMLIQCCISYIYQKRLIEIRMTKKTHAIVSFVEKNYAKDLTLETVCKSVGMSKTQLSKCLKNELGRTLFELIRDKRLDAALKMLRDTDMSISEIAESVGYSSSNYFTRVFASVYGVSPAQFRESERGRKIMVIPFIQT